jgi:HemK-related putative methylase
MSSIELSERHAPSIGRRVAIGATRAWLTLRYRLLSRRYDRLVLEQIDGVPLLVLPQVFNPVLLRTGAFMARLVARMPALAELDVLDMGTGSGVGAVFAALQGARVIAVDINLAAVRCARINALLNGLDDRIDAREGDLFVPVAGRMFDLVLFNPPFYRGAPTSGLDHAWRGQNVFERFAAGLDGALKPGGRALLILSSDGDGHELLTLLRSAGFAIGVAARKDLVNEVLSVYEVHR